MGNITLNDSPTARYPAQSVRTTYRDHFVLAIDDTCTDSGYGGDTYFVAYPAKSIVFNNSRYTDVFHSLTSKSYTLRRLSCQTRLPTSLKNSSTACSPYTSPEIVYELKLETHAGSPLIIDPLIDPLSVDPTTASLRLAVTGTLATAALLSWRGWRRHKGLFTSAVTAATLAASFIASGSPLPSSD